MNTNELETYLHQRIPLSRAMAVEVRSATPDGVELFDRSRPISITATPSSAAAPRGRDPGGWCALYVRMRAEMRAGRIVIRRNKMSYERPITGDFTAKSAPPERPPGPRRSRRWARAGQRAST